MSYIFEEQSNKKWNVKPLGLKGNLTTWQRRMKSKCPSPKLNEVVWLDGEFWDKTSMSIKTSSVAYKVIGFRKGDEPIWQRGQVSYH